MNDGKPVVGLILHFRTHEKTLRCLRSLFSEGAVGAVIVDNSADDGVSLKKIDFEILSLIKSGFEVHLIGKGFNMGFSRGVNYGLHYIKKNMAVDVLLINSDAVLEKNSLKAMMEERRGAGLVVPYLKNDSGIISRSSSGYYHKYLGLYLWTKCKGAFFYPSGCCLLIRSDVVSHDFLDEDFFFYGEDVLLGKVLDKKSIPVRLCERSSILHEGSGSAKNGSIFYEYNIVYGHMLLAYKLAENKLEILANILGRCFTLPVRAVYRSLKARSVVPIKALVWAFLDVLRHQRKDFTPKL